MGFLYPDVRCGNMAVHSEMRGGGYLLQFIRNNVVVQQQLFHDWDAYSRRYDLTMTMLRAKAQMGC